MRPNYKPPFLAFVKKQSRPFQLAIEDAVEDICAQPSIGVAKAGDLHGLRIFKFRYHGQQFLIAYCPTESAGSGKASGWQQIDFYQIGPHENFYSNLKKYLKS
ncbi:type II toxin-antitoxin system RelE/ParE family toxin [Pseudoduganella danionis]|uniref:Type II toxin-antitoxin system RelE/ParE family toxin n=1 Tax=Pseudoduganella danionis TaxID=1890295 RepID=A0ABW9SJ29_9BURK|nr:type II toxin-antitoxin system RelE/ParE family toxin [Pseudoduganella danionis]MTW31640.1 type II toxin-antitoxin system RelE/ParE family toxin [Pseudoduganella danionis]